MAVRTLEEEYRLAGLRWRWAGLTFGGALLLAAGHLALHAWWGPDFALRWLILAGAAGAYLSLSLGLGLPANRRAGESALLPILGAGTRLTLLRGALVAGLAGFLFSPRPPGWLGWAPGAFYTLAAFSDLFDGYLARRRNQATRLGELLDLRLDGLGVLVAALLAVQYGQAPAAYLLVGLARYLFLAGLWLLQKLGRRVYPLPPSRVRRPLAGLQMGFLAAALWPFLSPAVARPAAALFALPFLAGFALDGLAAAGALRLNSARRPARYGGRQTATLRWGRLALRWAPLALRAVAVAALAASLSAPGAVSIDALGRAPFPASATAPAGGAAALLQFAGLLLLALGAAGRLGAMAALLGAGLRQGAPALPGSELLLVACSVGLIFLGTGAFSLWAPEERLLHHRLGEEGVERGDS